GVSDEVVELCSRIGCVERVVDGADLQSCQIQVDVGNRFVDLNQNAIAGLHAKCCQRVRHAGHVVKELGIRHICATRYRECRCRAGGAEPLFKCRVEVSFDRHELCRFDLECSGHQPRAGG